MAERKLPVIRVLFENGEVADARVDRPMINGLSPLGEEYVPRDAIEPKRPLQWRPLPELTGESRYILVANTEHVASRIRYNSRASVSIEQLCLQQEGYEPTHFCELPEFDGSETELARPLQCRECRHWLEYGTPVGPDFKSVAVGYECTKEGGLESPPRDGSGFCSYAEPRESEPDNA